MQAGPPSRVRFTRTQGGANRLGIVTMPMKFLAAPAVLAAVSLVATPAAAVELPSVSHQSPTQEVSQYGGFGWGWGGGYRGRHHRHRGRTTAGDVLAGVLILGTIAAVANAASKANQRPRYPDRYPYPDPRNDYRPQGLEGAADLCLREVERNARAREVTRVERSASGWLVTGQMADGEAFSCSIGADGRIEAIDVGGRAQSYGEADRQYGEDVYRSARADTEVETDVEVTAEAEAGPQPDYPGGPLPGDEGEVEVESDPEN